MKEEKWWPTNKNVPKSALKVAPKWEPKRRLLGEPALHSLRVQVS